MTYSIEKWIKVKLETLIMKILLINDNAGTKGGAEKYFFTLKEKLENVPTLNVFSLTFGERQIVSKNNYSFRGAKSNLAKLFWRFTFNPIIYWKIRRLLNKIKPDIVHIHNNKQFPISILAALQGYKTLQTAHDYSYLCPTAQNIHRNQKPCMSGITRHCFWQHQVKFNKFIYLLVAYSFYKIRRYSKKTILTYLAPSPLLANALQTVGMMPTVYVPPFVQMQMISYSSPKPKHFLFAGNLGSHKGTDLLIREFAIAAREDKNLKLTIAGMGPEEASMQKQIKQLNLTKQVEFVGWQNNLSPYFAQAAALIFASTGMESFGLTITEAMQHARPVIGINQGTSAWLIENEHTGLLFDAQTTGDLAKKLLFIAQNPERANQLGLNAKQKIRDNFNDMATLQQILNIYKNISQIARASLAQSS